MDEKEKNHWFTSRSQQNQVCKLPAFLQRPPRQSSPPRCAGSPDPPGLQWCRTAGRHPECCRGKQKLARKTKQNKEKIRRTAFTWGLHRGYRPGWTRAVHCGWSCGDPSCSPSYRGDDCLVPVCWSRVCSRCPVRMSRTWNNQSQQQLSLLDQIGLRAVMRAFLMRACCESILSTRDSSGGQCATIMIIINANIKDAYPLHINTIPFNVSRPDDSFL